MYYICASSYIAEMLGKKMKFISRKQQQLNFSGFSAYDENPADCPKIKEFQMEELFTVRKLSITKMMEEVKPIVMEKTIWI